MALLFGLAYYCLPSSKSNGEVQRLSPLGEVHWQWTASSSCTSWEGLHFSQLSDPQPDEDTQRCIPVFLKRNATTENKGNKTTGASAGWLGFTLDLLLYYEGKRIQTFPIERSFENRPPKPGRELSDWSSQEISGSNEITYMKGEIN